MGKRILSSIIISVAIFAAISCKTAFTPELQSKCGESLLELVDRFEGATTDTVITITVRLNKSLVEEEKVALATGCDLVTFRTLDMVVIIQAPTASVPCLSKYEFVKELRLSPAMSGGR